MKNLFVPYEIAQLAKDAGFNGPDLISHILLESGVLSENHISYFVYKNGEILYQQLTDWFREEHEIIITVEQLLKCNACRVHINTNIRYVSMKFEGDYYHAYNEALKQAFTLIAK